MEIPDNMLEHIKKVAEEMDHGEIIIKINTARKIFDVKESPVTRFHVKKENKDKLKSKPGGDRNG